MTIARQLFIMLAVVFLLIIAVAVGLIYQFASLSSESARLTGGLKQTSALNEEMVRANNEQRYQLQSQLDILDPRFPEKFERINFALGEKYTEYLKLDIGEQERMTVENIKSLQAEVSIVSMQVYELLRTDRKNLAKVRLLSLNQLESAVGKKFEALNSLQLNKLHTVVSHLQHSANRGMIAVFVLVAALILVLATSTIMIRRRILQPVNAILAVSDQIRQGEFSARLPVGRADEFGRLIEGFNYMAQSLATSYGDLERKVEERTRQLRDMQQQLVLSEKMSAVGQLVSGVAHELNNPLATIMGFAELAKMQGVESPLHSSIEKLLDDIISQVERCRRITSNLLQFSRQQEPHLAVVSVNEAIEKILQLRQYELETRNIRLVREYALDNPLINANEEKMQQVILNLLNNAHDAIQEKGRGGTIWIRTRTYEGHVVIEVLDDGTGFRSAERAFDPFYTTKEVGKGTGLGLSICYGIIREHEGDIKIKNWEKGAQVTITLSRIQATRPTEFRGDPSEDSKMCGEMSHLRALIVDDEAMLLQLQIAYLTKIGIQATGVATGAEALLHLEANQVDLVISDVRMPGAVDGIQLYEWLLANRPGLAGKFLLTSGDLVGLNLGEFFERTGVPRIAKPFRFDDYANAIRRILESGGLTS